MDKFKLSYLSPNEMFYKWLGVCFNDCTVIKMSLLKNILIVAIDRI